MPNNLNYICGRYVVIYNLFSHYKVEQNLDVPIIEYSRYVLTNGAEGERTFLAKGIGPVLIIHDGKLEFS